MTPSLQRDHDRILAHVAELIDARTDYLRTSTECADLREWVNRRLGQIKRRAVERMQRERQ